MNAILIALVVLMWILSLVLSWINCRQRERLVERADEIEKKLESAITAKEEYEALAVIREKLRADLEECERIMKE